MSTNEYSDGALASLSAIANYIEYTEGYRENSISRENRVSSENNISSESSTGSVTSNSSASVLAPLIIEPQILSAQARLNMYISVAARASDLHVMETAFGIALRTIRSIQNAAISSTMPTAAKLKTCETPILNLALEFAGKSPEWRALIVQMMVENVSTGSGHLSINRAKQVLKEIAKRAPFNNLTDELKQAGHLRRMAAIYLLGWLKHEKAIKPLVDAFEVANEKQQCAILEMLEEHYSHKLPFYLKWRCANRQSPTPALAKLMQLLKYEA